MSLLSESFLESEAALLLRQLSDGTMHGSFLGLMSVSIYDTAWVSMVSRNRDGGRFWLFPRSFQYLLDNQSPQGGWHHNTSDVDSILNTLAALLSMTWHQKGSSIGGCPDLPEDIDLRISNTIAWLGRKLFCWNVESCDQVGFELLIPSLLDLLHQEDINFDFPGLHVLMSLRSKKLSRFDPLMLYGADSSTLVHSLEAFVGIIDYNKVHHQVNGGSMMASPSSTAAYLIYVSSWNDAAEDYLHTVQNKCPEYGSGGFPSAFPASIFAISWVLSTLLEAGLSPRSLEQPDVVNLANFLQEALAHSDGTVGFAPGLLADADDTSKSLLTLSLLGRAVDPSQMVARFDMGTHFQTYAGERNASFSANCNVLSALLHLEAPSLYAAQIISAASFICGAWYTGSVNDKWVWFTPFMIQVVTLTLLEFIGSLFYDASSTNAHEVVAAVGLR